MGRLPRGKRGTQPIHLRINSISGCVHYSIPSAWCKEKGRLFPATISDAVRPAPAQTESGSFPLGSDKRGKACGRGTDTGAAPTKDRPESPSAAARLSKGTAVCEAFAGHWSHAVGKRLSGKSDKKAADSGLSPPPASVEKTIEGKRSSRMDKKPVPRPGGRGTGFCEPQGTFIH